MTIHRFFALFLTWSLVCPSALEAFALPYTFVPKRSGINAYFDAQAVVEPTFITPAVTALQLAGQEAKTTHRIEIRLSERGRGMVAQLQELQSQVLSLVSPDRQQTINKLSLEDSSTQRLRISFVQQLTSLYNHLERELQETKDQRKRRDLLLMQLRIQQARTQATLSAPYNPLAGTATLSALRKWLRVLQIVHSGAMPDEAELQRRLQEGRVLDERHQQLVTWHSQINPFIGDDETPSRRRAVLLENDVNRFTSHFPLLDSMSWELLTKRINDGIEMLRRVPGQEARATRHVEDLERSIHDAMKNIPSEHVLRKPIDEEWAKIKDRILKGARRKGLGGWNDAVEILLDKIRNVAKFFAGEAVVEKSQSFVVAEPSTGQMIGELVTSVGARGVEPILAVLNDHVFGILEIARPNELLTALELIKEGVHVTPDTDIPWIVVWHQLHEWWVLPQEQRADMTQRYTQRFVEEAGSLADEWRVNMEAVGQMVTWWCVQCFLANPAEAPEAIARSLGEFRKFYIPTPSMEELQGAIPVQAAAIASLFSADEMRSPWTITPEQVRERREERVSDEERAAKAFALARHRLAQRAFDLGFKDLEFTAESAENPAVLESVESQLQERVQVQADFERARDALVSRAQRLGDEGLETQARSALDLDALRGVEGKIAKAEKVQEDQERSKDLRKQIVSIVTQLSGTDFAQRVRRITSLSELEVLLVEVRAALAKDLQDKQDRANAAEEAAKALHDKAEQKQKQEAAWRALWKESLARVSVEYLEDPATLYPESAVRRAVEAARVGEPVVIEGAAGVRPLIAILKSENLLAQSNMYVTDAMSEAEFREKAGLEDLGEAAARIVFVPNDLSHLDMAWRLAVCERVTIAAGKHTLLEERRQAAVEALASLFDTSNVDSGSLENKIPIRGKAGLVFRAYTGAPSSADYYARLLSAVVADLLDDNADEIRAAILAAYGPELVRLSDRCQNVQDQDMNAWIGPQTVLHVVVGRIPRHGVIFKCWAGLMGSRTVFFEWRDFMPYTRRWLAAAGYRMELPEVVNPARWALFGLSPCCDQGQWFNVQSYIVRMSEPASVASARSLPEDDALSPQAKSRRLWPIVAMGLAAGGFTWWWRSRLVQPSRGTPADGKSSTEARPAGKRYMQGMATGGSILNAESLITAQMEAMDVRLQNPGDPLVQFARSYRLTADDLGVAITYPNFYDDASKLHLLGIMMPTYGMRQERSYTRKSGQEQVAAITSRQILFNGIFFKALFARHRSLVLAAQSAEGKGQTAAAELARRQARELVVLFDAVCLELAVCCKLSIAEPDRFMNLNQVYLQAILEPAEQRSTSVRGGILERYVAQYVDSRVRGVLARTDYLSDRGWTPETIQALWRREAAWLNPYVDQRDELIYFAQNRTHEGRVRLGILRYEITKASMEKSGTYWYRASALDVIRKMLHTYVLYENIFRDHRLEIDGGWVRPAAARPTDIFKALANPDFLYKGQEPSQFVQPPAGALNGSMLFAVATRLFLALSSVGMSVEKIAATVTQAPHLSSRRNFFVRSV